ncbi:hypothetical protein [Paenibacillus pseudetheri]|uniref:Uncharacterized protein n=1 Tax=Paenibacillus pseudetheri TaxID=2897682 RepID=A0ABM9BDY9_9BACL|nr:hypothetical protein [Paenibacillus pseudetheri]CAH1056824.1 hypothetical protein PAECIP111894_02979 [Paenibacillus pseudetheri]
MKIRHVRVPYSLLELNIPNESKAVYIAIMSFRIGNKKTIKVSMNSIAYIAGLKERRINHHITELCRHNMLSRKQINFGVSAYGCNTYTIQCDEKRFAEIPWCIAYEKQLKASSLIAYCIMKQHTNIKKQDYTCYLSKKELAEFLTCSLNQVDKVKGELKNAGLIICDYNSKKILLAYEQQEKV